MTMSFFFHDGADGFDGFEYGSSSGSYASKPGREDLHILREKLRQPRPDGLIARPRLDEMLEKSLSQFNATLVSGRAGTGKTALAASFAARYAHVAWYSVGPTDVDWFTFSRYFAAGIAAACDAGSGATQLFPRDGGSTRPAIAEFLVDTFTRFKIQRCEPLLIVLDDLHRIFDAEWFGEFFPLLLYSLPENTHLLLLCRSRPPSPLWRLRSKQVLNVIDEKLLAFTQEETARFLAPASLSEIDIEKAHSESFGRISRLQQIAGPESPA